MPFNSHAIRGFIACGRCTSRFEWAASAYAAGTALVGNDEAHFLAENDQAITKMMGGMSVKPSGNVDEDFVAMMVPHHQGAIDMAKAELSY